MAHPLVGLSESRRLANWCAQLRSGDAPDAVRAQLPLRVLDTVGLVVAGSATPAGEFARDYVRCQAGAAQSTLCGSQDRVPPAMAALVHGVAAHCRDFDDTFVDSVVHPGSVIVSTALALAEARTSSTEDFSAALLAGYEVAARIGAVAGRRFHAHSLHATGVVGPIAAAAAAGRILGLNGEQIAWAMGLASSMSGGLMAFLADGGWSKWLHVGWAAHGGIIAAELASRGFRGPERVLDGGHDLYSALLHQESIDRSALSADLGSRWSGAKAEVKYYPCAHVIQPYIDAVLTLVARHGLRAADIAAIDCVIAPWAADIVCVPREAKLRFDTELEVIASLPYQLAVAAIDRRVDLGALEASSRGRADLRELAGRINHRIDPSFGRTFDGSVEIHMRSGARHAMKAVLADTDVLKLKQKFVSLLAPSRGEAQAQDAAAALLQPGAPDWRVAADILGGAR